MAIDLDELERLAAQATPGPWFHTTCDMVGTTASFFDEDFLCVCRTDVPEENKHSTDNAAYITAACNAVPELVARVRELERQRNKLLGMYCNEMVCSWCWLDEVCPHFDETIVRRNPNSEGCRETLRKWLEQAAKEAGE